MHTTLWDVKKGLTGVGKNASCVPPFFATPRPSWPWAFEPKA